MDLARQLQNLLGAVSIRPRRLWLDTADVRASVPMLRGVWGAALHALNHSVYQTVFEGAGPNHERTPLFVLRPAPLSRQGAAALDWITIGAALDQDPCLLAAWQRTCEMGLGPDRKPFRILDVEALGPQGAGGSDDDGAGSCWPLGQAAWPLSSAPAETACRLVFPAPLRIMRKERLLEQPNLADLVVAGLRRVNAWTWCAIRPARRQSWKCAASPDPSICPRGRKVSGRCLRPLCGCTSARVPSSAWDSSS
jgi:hypothetical protein